MIKRLVDQKKRVFDFMKDAEWRTLQDIEDATGDPQASISAQLRHLRKERFGGHTVEKHHIKNGLYVYRLLVNEANNGSEMA